MCDSDVGCVWTSAQNDVAHKNDAQNDAARNDVAHNDLEQSQHRLSLLDARLVVRNEQEVEAEAERLKQENEKLMHLLRAAEAAQQGAPAADKDNASNSLQEIERGRLEDMERLRIQNQEEKDALALQLG